MGDTWKISGGCLVDILLISGGYLGQVCISWAYIGDIMGIYWGYLVTNMRSDLGDILGIYWGYLMDIVGIS